MGSKMTEIVSQASAGNGILTTDSDRVETAIVGAGPTESGEDQSHYEIIRDWEEADVWIELRKLPSFPFRRLDRLGISPPPRPRTGSLRIEL